MASLVATNAAAPPAPPTAPPAITKSIPTSSANEQSSASTHWNHTDDELLSECGLTYEVTYCGSVNVLRPMKDLDFQSRTILARECIDRIYTALNPQSTKKPRSASVSGTGGSPAHQLANFVSQIPDLTHGNVPVTVSVNIERLLITDHQSGNAIGKFQLSLVSFASKGDDDVATYVAFVAKDPDQGRACHVLMAPTVGVAKELIGTLGQAFDLKFSRLVAQRNNIVKHAGDMMLQAQASIASSGMPQVDHGGSHNNSNSSNNAPPKLQAEPQLASGLAGLKLSAPSPLISSTPNMSYSPQQNNKFANGGGAPVGISHHIVQPPLHHQRDEFDREYVNDSMGSAHSLISPIPAQQSFESSLSSPLKCQQKQGVYGQPWFHGSIDREESEARLINHGDFLVRESSRTPGQFVLSGRTEFCGVKHLLLVDPEGVVRTRDRQFVSVAHLVQHHSSSQTPIISQDVEIFLKHPVNVNLFVKG